MGARWYDPTTGGFTQADSSGQEVNPYLYAAGNPINDVDPTGLYSWETSVIKWGVGGIIGVTLTGITDNPVIGTAAAAYVPSSIGKMSDQYQNDGSVDDWSEFILAGTSAIFGGQVSDSSGLRKHLGNRPGLMECNFLTEKPSVI